MSYGFNKILVFILQWMKINKHSTWIALTTFIYQDVNNNWLVGYLGFMAY